MKLSSGRTGIDLTPLAYEFPAAPPSPPGDRSWDCNWIEGARPGGRSCFDRNSIDVNTRQVTGSGKRVETWLRRALRGRTIALVAIATATTAVLPMQAAPAATPAAIYSEPGWYSPRVLATGPNGALYLAVYVQPTGSGSSSAVSDIIVKRASTGSLSIVAGKIGKTGKPTPGKATASAVYQPHSGVVDSRGNLYVSQSSYNSVLKITPGGQLSVIAGIPGSSGRPTPGPAKQSKLSGPGELAIDSRDNLYVADFYNSVVAKITPQGTLSIFAGTVGQRGNPEPGAATETTVIPIGGLAVDRADNVYIASGAGSRAPRVVAKVTAEGQLTVAVGNGEWGAPRHGAVAADSALGALAGLAIDRNDRLHLVTHNNISNNPTFAMVLRVNADGTYTRIAGRASGRGTFTPGTATASKLEDPHGLVLDAAGSLFTNDYAVVSGRVRYHVLRVGPAKQLSSFMRTYTKS